LRLFVDIHSNVCGQRYLIENGTIRTENTTISLNDLDFYYSCELRNIIEEPEMFKTEEGQKLLENTFKRKFGDHWRDILDIYNNFNELIDAKELRAMKYVRLIQKLEKISNNEEFRNFYSYLESNVKKIFAESIELARTSGGKTYDQLVKNPDYNAKLSEDDLQKIFTAMIDAIKWLT